MFRSGVVAAAIAAAGILLTGYVAPASAAQQMSPMVAVPAPVPGGGGAGVTGCYNVDGVMYGQYRMSFCLDRNGGGNYNVRGGGLNCNGGIEWYDTNNGRVSVDLDRSFCGRGMQWTGDSMNCRVSGWSPKFGIKGGGFEANVAVPVPVPPIFKTLNCRYVPMAGGYSPINIVARKN